MDEKENLLDQPEPEKIDIFRFLNVFRKGWKQLLILLIVCGGAMTIIRPATSTTTYGATCTLYIPPYYEKKQGETSVMVSNNLSQISNALGLIQSVVYREKIAQQLNAVSLSDFGTYSVNRKKDTEIITINANASGAKEAEQLCNAVLNEFQNGAGKSVSIESMELVNPVTPYSSITATSTLQSVVIGAAIGFVIYLCLTIFRFFHDKTLPDPREAEKYLGIPVLCVLPVIEERK